MERKNVYSSSPFEESVGFSRAVRIGPHVHVAGTAAVGDDGKAVHPYDAHKQARFILKRIEWALNEAGASLKDVVRTRTYVTDPKYIEGASKVHHEFFQDIRPASTMLAISELVDPEMVVEIEATAYIT